MKKGHLKSQTVFRAPTVVSTFRATLDDGIKRGLLPLTKGRQVDQSLVQDAWRIVVGEIMNACDQHSAALSEKAVTWLADAYFRSAIRLKMTDGTNAFDSTTSTNNVSVSDLTDEDIKTLSLHLKGSIFEREVTDESKNRV